MTHQMYPPIQNAMGGTNLHTPPSIFQHMMGQQSTQQSGPWTQMPHVPPMSIPWSITRDMQSLQQPELVRFTGGSSLEPILHQKRKLETPDLLDMRRTKQFITEEEMAAHFKKLDISSNYQSQPCVPSALKSEAQTVIRKGVNMELEIDTDADQLKSGLRLVLSEELKRLQKEPILPNSLLSKLERPSMALVLWEPPSKHLRVLPTRNTASPIPSASDDNNNSNNNNNNNEAISDLNQTLPSNSAIFEPMEL